MVGLIDAVRARDPQHVSADTRSGDRAARRATPTSSAGASISRGFTASWRGAPPRCDLDAERALIDALLAAVQCGRSSGPRTTSAMAGLAVAIAECCIGDREHLVGADVDLSAWSALADSRALLFGEGQGRIVVSTADAAAVVLAIAREHGVPARQIGTVRPGPRELRIAVGGTRVARLLERLAAAYHGAIPGAMGIAAVVQAAEEPAAAGSLV